MKMEEIHVGMLIWWDERVEVLAFTEIGVTFFKLLSLRDFQERTFVPTSRSPLSDADFAPMRPCTIEEARVYLKGVFKGLQEGVRKKEEELNEVKGELDSYLEKAKDLLRKQGAESVSSVP